jgi:2-isopropylmalate synthase
LAEGESGKTAPIPFLYNFWPKIGRKEERMKDRIKIFDTTLRDGEQAPGCSMNLQEKWRWRTARAAAVDVIEAGFAISPRETSRPCRLCRIHPQLRGGIPRRCSEKDIDAAWEALRRAVSPASMSLSQLRPSTCFTSENDAGGSSGDGRRWSVMRKNCVRTLSFRGGRDAGDPAFLAQVVRAAVRAART